MSPLKDLAMHAIDWPLEANTSVGKKSTTPSIFTHISICPQEAKLWDASLNPSSVRFRRSMGICVPEMSEIEGVVDFYPQIYIFGI